MWLCVCLARLNIAYRWRHFLRIQITAENANDFSRWFGWVESRLRHFFIRYVPTNFAHTLACVVINRVLLWLASVANACCFLLVCSCRLEAVPELRIYPFARFFDFKAPDDDATGEKATATTHTSWFFIAMSFHIPKTSPETSSVPSGGHNVDLTHVIQEFAFIVDQWDERHSGGEGHMDLQIDHLRREEIPKWVVESTDGVQQPQQQQDGLTKKQKKRMMDGGAVALASAVALEDPKCFSDDDTPHARKNGFTHGKRAKSSASVSNRPVA